MRIIAKPQSHCHHCQCPQKTPFLWVKIAIFMKSPLCVAEIPMVSVYVKPHVSVLGQQVPIVLVRSSWSCWKKTWKKTQFSSIFLVKSQPHRIHGAGIYANMTGYIDGIHGAPYIAAPWILWELVFGYLGLKPSIFITQPPQSRRFHRRYTLASTDPARGICTRA